MARRTTRNSILRSLSQYPACTQDQSPLFKIPPEIRNEIFKLVLTVEPCKKSNLHPAIELRPCKDIWQHPYPETIPGPTVLEFLTTCRLVYFEAAALFYRCNALTLHSYDLYPQDSRVLKCGEDGPGKIWASIGPLRLTAVRDLTVVFGRFDNFDTVCKRLRVMRGLETLRLEFQHRCVGRRRHPKDYLMRGLWRAEERLESIFLSFQSLGKVSLAVKEERVSVSGEVLETERAGFSLYLAPRRRALAEIRRKCRAS